VAEYSGDHRLASLFVDALLYDATGCEAGTPTESEVLNEGTHKVRGISKYAIGRQQLKVPDVEGWMFGKEFAALSGHAMDVAYVLAVTPNTIMIRGHGKWMAEYCIKGTLPTEAEKEA
jgi:hypothetical protein